MFNVRNFLKPFTQLQSQELLVQKAVGEAITTILKIQIPQESILFQNNIIFLRVVPVIKHACFLQKEKVLLAIKETLPPHISVKDIR